MSQDDFDKGYRHGHAEADVDCYNITQKLNVELSTLQAQLAERDVEIERLGSKVDRLRTRNNMKIGVLSGV